MPITNLTSTVTLDSNVTLNYRADGREDAPVVVLSNSLGTDLSLWEPQLPAFAERFRVVRYDSRGHGNSSAPEGPYSMSELADDVVGLLDALDVPTAHFVGISIGGLTGLYLALAHRNRLDKLVVANTAAKIGTPDAWHNRATVVRDAGVASIASGVVEKWLTPDYYAAHPQTVEALENMLSRSDDNGYAATCLALPDADLREQLTHIAVPTLAIGASQDLPTPPADTRYIAERVPGAAYAELSAAHISNQEAAEEFTRVVLEFLD